MTLFNAEAKDNMCICDNLIQMQKKLREAKQLMEELRDAYMLCSCFIPLDKYKVVNLTICPKVDFFLEKLEGFIDDFGRKSDIPNEETAERHNGNRAQEKAQG